MNHLETSNGKSGQSKDNENDVWKYIFEFETHSTLCLLLSGKYLQKITWSGRPLR